QLELYERNLLQHRDMKAVIQTAVEEAVEKAVEEAAQEKAIEIAKNLIGLGLDNISIAKATGLTAEQIEQLRR
ncbi:MAG: hypothetical protein RMJ44_06780, partial [Cytophagales bacterium]|nr:hypothetical protein [Cytophagales bacterium]